MVKYVYNCVENSLNLALLWFSCHKMIQSRTFIKYLNKQAYIISPLINHLISKTDLMIAQYQSSPVQLKI